MEVVSRVREPDLCQNLGYANTIYIHISVTYSKKIVISKKMGNVGIARKSRTPRVTSAGNDLRFVRQHGEVVSRVTELELCQNLYANTIYIHVSVV